LDQSFSEEKARSNKFQHVGAIADAAFRASGWRYWIMCTTRYGRQIAEVRAYPDRWDGFHLSRHAYAHKYANAVTSLKGARSRKSSAEDCRT
jgi:hypothetical protein